MRAAEVPGLLVDVKREVQAVPEIGFATKVVKGVPVVTTPAEVDVANAAMLRATLLRAAVGGDGAVILDMSGTQFCDSAGLSVLIRAYRRTLAEGGSLRFVTSTPQVNRIFKVTGLDRLFRPFRTLEEAFESLGQRPQKTV